MMQDEPIMMIDVESSKAYYYHCDGLGSVIALSDSAGRTVEMYEYDVYGNTIIWAPTQEPPDTSLYGNPYMFTGRRFDTETRLYYYRARYYSTEIGRFLQVDPIGYEEGMNLYTYCWNNPLNWIDPWGLCPDSKNWIGGSVLATAIIWADVLGVGKYNQFGSHIIPPEYLDNFINPYPNAGRPGAIADEKFWDRVHFAFGFGFGLAGFSGTSTRNILGTWETTEPGIWSGWGSWGGYQGRNVFEEGQRGIQRDMKSGMRGYRAGRLVIVRVGLWIISNRDYF